MNAIQKAISDLHFRIPKAILEKAFISRVVAWRQTVHTNLDEQILNLVIKPRVLVDCNLLGGTQALIPLEGLPFDHPDSRTTVVHIPKNRTQGRSVNSVLHVAFISQSSLGAYAAGNGFSSTMGSNYSENSAAMGAAVGMMNAVDKIPVSSTAQCQLISENTIMIRDVISIPSNAYLRCVLANDDDLGHIQMRSYLPFCKLVEYAVKSYIYNNLVVEVDTAELQGGQQLGIFKTVMESYADSEENYQDYLRDKWQKIAIMNDFDGSYSRLLKLTIGGNR